MEITPPPVKFELHLFESGGSERAVDVSGSVKDWRELEIEMSREGLSGVYSEISSPFNFVLDAYDIVESFYNANGFAAKAKMYIYLRKNDWTYEPPKIFDLDFSTYKKTDGEISVNARKVSLYDFVKSKGSVKIDIPVSEIAYELPFRFERVALENDINFEIFNEFTDFVDSGTNASYTTVGIAEGGSDTPIKDAFMSNVVAENQETRNKDFPFIECVGFDISNCTLELNIEIDITMNDVSDGAYPIIDVSIVKNEDVGHPVIIAVPLRTISGNTYKFTDNTSAKNQISMSKNDKLTLYLYRNRYAVYRKMNGKITGTLKVAYNGVKTTIGANNSVWKTTDLPVIRPAVLLQSLVDRMTETTGRYAAGVNSIDEALDNQIVILSAESARRFDKAKIHTSYKDFEQWMNVLGYEPDINETSLTFKKRELFFLKEQTAIELSEEDCAGLEETVNTEYIYSNIRIGYNKQEYESKNGRYEPNNGANEYSTDISIVQNELELISPYRADAYGIEFLLLDSEDKSKTKDNKSDSNVFFINVRQVRGYLLARKAQMIVPNEDIPGEVYGSFINTYYMPDALARINRSLFEISANSLFFKSMDANFVLGTSGNLNNSDIVSGHPKNPLFDFSVFEFSSRNIKNIPDYESRNGLVKFRYRGRDYAGFIKKISKNPAWETETTWKLYGTCSLYPVTEYTVTYDARGGSAVSGSPFTVAAGSEHTVESTIRPSFALSGWATSPYGAVAYTTGQTITVNSNLTLYAVWEPVGGTTRNVTFDPNTIYLDKDGENKN
jgi:hypothetical protein